MTTMRCDNCGGPLVYGEPTCGWCDAPQGWSRLPDLSAGPADQRWAFPAEPLPGPVSDPGAQPHRSGHVVPLDDRQLVSGHTDLALRDGWVRMTAAALDPGVGFGVLARVSTTGSMRCGLALTVRPDLRSWTLALLLWQLGGRSLQRPLVRWEHHPAIAGLGEWNAVELRFADSIVAVHINDQHVRHVLDATVGYGAPGWRVASFEAAGRVCIHDLAVGPN